MSEHRPLLSLLSGIFVVSSFALLGACGPTHTGLCERAADCGNGREPEIDSCIIDMDAREEQAEIFSCEKEWDDYLNCLDDSGSCNADNNALGGCEANKDSLNGCIGERRSGQAKVELRSGGIID